MPLEISSLWNQSSLAQEPLAHRQDGMQQIHPHVTAGNGGHVVPRQQNGHIKRATEYRLTDGRFRQEDKLGKRVDEPVLSIVGRRRQEDATQRRRQKGTRAGMGKNPLLDGARAQDASLGHGQCARRSTVADPRIDLDSRRVEEWNAAVAHPPGPPANCHPLPLSVSGVAGASWA